MGQTCAAACQQKNLSFDEINIEEDIEQDQNVPTEPEDKKSQKAPSKNPSKKPNEVEEKAKGESRKEISVMTSKINQSRSYLKFGAAGVKLDKMPDYSNELVRSKKEQLG